MKKQILLIIGAVIIVILGFGIYKFNFTNSDIYVQNGAQINEHDGIYVVDGKVIILKNGISEVEAAPGSASKIITRYFGNDIESDLNADGMKDRAFFITQQTGGSGTFYYVVALLKTPNGNMGSHAFFLGDRIAPQSINMEEGKDIVVVNYADRKPTESFAVAPSEGKSVWLQLDIKTMKFSKVK